MSTCSGVEPINCSNSRSALSTRLVGKGPQPLSKRARSLVRPAAQPARVAKRCSAGAGFHKERISRAAIPVASSSSFRSDSGVPGSSRSRSRTPSSGSESSSRTMPCPVEPTERCDLPEQLRVGHSCLYDHVHAVFPDGRGYVIVRQIGKGLQDGQ